MAYQLSNVKPELEVSVPRRLSIQRPVEIGPSKFPSSVDELKLIEYSSVPAGGQLEADLKQYYTILSSVASNTASQDDLVALKNLMVRVRNYVLTEDDFNLMSDSVRTTQEYLIKSMEAADGNFELVSSVAVQLVEQINEWSIWLQSEVQKLGTEKGLGGAVIYGELAPGPSAFGYLWVNDNLEDDYIAPAIGFEEGDFLRNSVM